MNFQGRLYRYPEIYIDNFKVNPNQDQITCFILTHFHTDHMKYLSNNLFDIFVNENGETINLYCSPITKTLMENTDPYKNIASKWNTAPCESPFIVKLNNKESVNVTFYGSGHCPGSIMVLIEGSRGNVLFTGDFRLPLNSHSRLSFINQHQIHDLYIDMTFFKLNLKKIPSREESVSKLAEFLKENINPKQKNLFFLQMNAKVGYEFVYQEIQKSTGYKIHVDSVKYQLYNKIPAVQSNLTTDPDETPIHCCLSHGSKSKSNCLKNKPGYKFIKIILSTMWFTQTELTDSIFVQLKLENNQMFSSLYRLCYSFHSSTEEIIDFVSAVQPKNKIYPIAIPDNLNEETVNSYFFDTDGKFCGFSANKSNSENGGKSGSIERLVGSKELFLKERKLEFNSEYLCRSSSEESLNFGDNLSDDDSIRKKKEKHKNELNRIKFNSLRRL